MSTVQPKVSRASKHAEVSNTVLSVLSEAASVAQKAGLAFEVSSITLRGDEKQVIGSAVQVAVGAVAHELELNLPYDEVKLFTSRAGEITSRKTVLGLDAFTPAELSRHILNAFARHDAVMEQVLQAAQEGTAFQGQMPGVSPAPRVA